MNLRSIPPHGIGAVSAAVGTIVGLVLGIIPALLLWLFLECDPDAGFECLGAALFATFVGVVGGAIGALGGCFLALKRGGHGARPATLVFLFVLVIPASMVLGLITSVVDRLGAVAVSINTVFGLLTVAAMAAGARWLALWWAGRRSKSDDPSDILGTPPL